MVCCKIEGASLLGCICRLDVIDWSRLEDIVGEIDHGKVTQRRGSSISGTIFFLLKLCLRSGFNLNGLTSCGVPFLSF